MDSMTFANNIIDELLNHAEKIRNFKKLLSKVKPYSIKYVMQFSKETGK